ncbi:hypothetical protein [Mesorhizobium sp. M6A.T.Cr.TU.016.01.1.1]|uniref:hypothetical protein n=1 Tax=Mesorhizobium sp. M6A.T.Cr.TU.016.01.1.1 TaxID=2493677 RepID=UPI0013DF52BB|nr:hypothetical protein [Mesorhizobium sp. M6A.T.Cr.TU.016.01.1.1]
MSNLKTLMQAEAKAHRALMNDPRCLADPKAEHTPAILAAWEAAADALRAHRQQIAA